MKPNHPAFIQKLEAVDPVWHKLAADLQDQIMAPGALDSKSKLLTLLAVDAFAGSSGVQGISDAARRLGASEAEISETLRIAYLVAGNKVLHTSMNAYR